MRFKLDENFGVRTTGLFQAAGHEVHTVRGERLNGCSDERLFEVCCAEHLCLVTLDLDFADVTRFPPSQASGVIVIRVPRNPSLTLLQQLVGQTLQRLTLDTVEGKLWVVEVGRIRIHETEMGES